MASNDYLREEGGITNSEERCLCGCGEDIPEPTPAPEVTPDPAPVTPPPVAAPPPVAPPPPVAVPPPPAVAPPPASTNSNPILAALAYPIPIIAIVIIASDMKRDRKMAFHGWNALFLFLAYIVVGVALVILTIATSQLGPLGKLFGMLTNLLHPAWLVVAILAAIKANSGQEFNLPVISDMARSKVGGA